MHALTALCLRAKCRLTEVVKLSRGLSAVEAERLNAKPHGHESETGRILLDQLATLWEQGMIERPHLGTRDDLQPMWSLDHVSLVSIIPALLRSIS